MRRGREEGCRGEGKGMRRGREKRGGVKRGREVKWGGEGRADLVCIQ